MYCAEIGCYNPAQRKVSKNGTDRKVCDSCYMKTAKITVEFCMWLQEEQVFDMFVNHLNKGIKIDQVLKKGAGK